MGMNLCTILQARTVVYITHTLRRLTKMSQQKRRKEAAWKSRKQEQHPHGKIKSLKEISNEYDAEHTTT